MRGFFERLTDPRGTNSWAGSGAGTLLKRVWAVVEASKVMGYCIKRVFVTGVKPFLLNGLTHQQQYKSFDQDIPTICGLTQSDTRERCGLSTTRGEGGEGSPRIGILHRRLPLL